MLPNQTNPRSTSPSGRTAPGRHTAQPPTGRTQEFLLSAVGNYGVTVLSGLVMVVAGAAVALQQMFVQLASAEPTPPPAPPAVVVGEAPQPVGDFYPPLLDEEGIPFDVRFAGHAC